MSEPKRRIFWRVDRPGKIASNWQGTQMNAASMQITSFCPSHILCLPVGRISTQNEELAVICAVGCIFKTKQQVETLLTVWLRWNSFDCFSQFFPINKFISNSFYFLIEKLHATHWKKNWRGKNIMTKFLNFDPFSQNCL